MSVKTLTQSYYYSLASVNLPEAAPECCRGVFHSNGLTAFAALMANTVDARPNVLDLYTLELALNAFFEEVIVELAQNHRVTIESLGITFSLEIGGSFPSMDAAPGEDNPLYVAIHLDGDRWNVLDGVVPVRTEASADAPKMFAVEDAASHRPGVIDGVKPFVTTGRNLAVSVPGEQIRLVDSTKATHVATVDSCQRGQRLVAHFSAPAPAPAKRN